jgi:tetratricopeptide (TPR) repeat protein
MKTFCITAFVILGSYFGNNMLCAQTAESLSKEAQSLLEAGKHDEALAKADQAIAADAKYGEAYFRRGKIKGAKNDDKAALADYNKAVEMGYENAELYRLKAMAECLSGSNEQCCKDFSKAISLGDALSEDFKARFCK